MDKKAADLLILHFWPCCPGYPCRQILSNWDTAGYTPDDIPKLLEDIREGLKKSGEFDSKSLFNLDSNV